jgi:hypothetical protein
MNESVLLCSQHSTIENLFPVAMWWQNGQDDQDAPKDFVP